MPWQSATLALTCTAGPGPEDYAPSTPYSNCGPLTNGTKLLGPNHGYSCPVEQGQQCVIGDNPNFDFTSFDNFGEALLIMIQVSTAPPADSPACCS